MIIVINGTSSVGKSSIAKEIHLMTKRPFVTFCMDGFFSMLNPRFDGLGVDHLRNRDGDFKLGFYTSDISQGYRIEVGELGQKLDFAMAQCVAVCANRGLNLVVPTVISSKELFHHYKFSFQKFESFFVYVDCDRDEIKRRETSRDDRLKGTSLDLLDRFETKNDHDLIIDSTTKSPKELAIEICIAAKIDCL